MEKFCSIHCHQCGPYDVEPALLHYSSATLVRVHDAALAEEYVVSLTFNNVGRPGSLLITSALRVCDTEHRMLAVQ